MKDDGFAYPIRSYTSNCGKKCYAYRCGVCGLEIGGYYQKRVKGKITCRMCRNRIARNKYRQQKIEDWMLSISEN